jgi:hypothetical protein
LEAPKIRVKLEYFNNGANRVGNDSIISLMAGGVKKEVVGLRQDSRILANRLFPYFEGYQGYELPW